MDDSFPLPLLEQPPWHEFTVYRGYNDRAQQLILQVVKDHNKAQKLWREFSPQSTLFHEWEIRQAFYEGFRFTPYFLTLSAKNASTKTRIAVLPLWHDTESDTKEYVWFGGNWMEDNVFFASDPELIPLLLAAAPQPLYLANIQALPRYAFLETLQGFNLDEEKKYYLDLTQYHTIDDYLALLKKKKRYNLRRDRMHIQQLHPIVKINMFDHFDELIRLNIMRSRRKRNDPSYDPSPLEDERYQRAFWAIINNKKGAYIPRMISTLIEGNVQAVELGVVYKDTYNPLISGVNTEKYSGIGVFSNLLVMEDALRLGCKKIDFQEGDYNWKESWQLQSQIQYQFRK